VEIKVKKEIKPKKFPWKWFWIAILFLVVVEVVLVALGNMHKTPLKKVILKDIVEKFQQKNPQIVMLIKSLDKEAKQEISNYIKKEVEKLYEPVYDNLDAFIDYHYSLKGEYSEIIAAATNNLAKFIKEKIYDPAKFDERYKEMMGSIDNKIKEVIAKEYDKLKKNLKKEGINEEESEFLFTKILNYSYDDMLNRYMDYKYNTLKAMGIAAGISAGMLSKVLAKKILQKVAVKTGAKVASKVAASAAGAAVGAESGLLCGPGAIICSPVGAFVGGLVAWVASDKVILEIDKALNQEKFKKDIYNMVTQQKNALAKTLTYAFTKSLDELNKDFEKSIKELKNKPIKELVSN